MATVNKDFKIKYGLVVEGANATVNGNQILTETASDTYILNLIGGETLVKSVSNEFDVSVAGELSIDRAVVDAYYDAEGSAAAAQSAAETFATDADTALYGTVTTDIATAKSEAGVIAQGYADTAEADAISAAALDATTKADAAEDAANSYTDARETAITTAYQTYADQAETDAKAYTDTRETAITTAYQSYADTAEQDAKDYADTAIANLVDSAPATLDTLNELAAALQDNPDIISDLQDIAAGKQDTLTAGNNIDITGATISVTGLDTDDVAEGTNLYFTDARALTATAFAYDAEGSAATAEQNAKDYADSLAPNYDIAGAAAQALTDANANTTTVVNALTTDDIEEGLTNLYFESGRAKTAAAELLTGASLTNITITGTGAGLTITAENGVADSTTDDLAEGEENLYFNDERAIDAVSGADIYPNAVIINNLTKHVANQVTVATAGIATGISWAKASYRSAEFLVKVAYGDHTEISKVLLTLDINDNIAITEYGNVTTNGSASTVSADISGTDVRLRLTTVNNNSTVTVIGTLLA